MILAKATVMAGEIFSHPHQRSLDFCHCTIHAKQNEQEKWLVRLATETTEIRLDDTFNSCTDGAIICTILQLFSLSTFPILSWCDGFNVKHAQ